MDVSPETIRQVEFRERLRGYHQEDVDEFLERMAAGLEILQERLREVTERAVRAERQVRDASEGEDSLRRTLVLAQRTADLAVQEAHEQAARIVESATAQGQAIVAQAEEDAHRMAREMQSQIWADIGRLEAAREQLRQDAAALEAYIEEERGKAQTALAEAARELQKLIPSVAPAPRLHDLDLTGVRSWITPREPEPPRQVAGAQPEPRELAPRDVAPPEGAPTQPETARELGTAEPEGPSALEQAAESPVTELDPVPPASSEPESSIPEEHQQPSELTQP
jgi:DivIVA domain-containing protein